MIDDTMLEAEEKMDKAVSVAKSRTTPHQASIREFRLGPEGIELGRPLEDFEGVLTGLPTYRGRTPLMASDPAVAGD